MARSSFVITVDERTPLTIADKPTKVGRALLRKVIRQLEGILGGVVNASHVQIAVDGAQPVAASGTYTMNAANVADTVSINGAAITAVAGAASNDQFDQSGNATAEAVSLANAINTSTTALISKHCEASNFAGSVTLATCTAGSKLLFGMHEFTAIAAANTTPQANQGDFSISGNDTADAAALVVAINTHPVLSHDLVASNSAGVVTIRQRRGTAAYAVMTVSAIAGVVQSGISITTQFVSTTTVLVSAINPDQTGNAITTAESTAGARITVGQARLVGGTGGSSGTVVRMIQGAFSR